MSPFILFIVAFVLGTVGVLANIPVSLTNNGPAVRGSNVTFIATILSDDYKGVQLKFIFNDDALPQHYQEIISTERSVNYTFEYNRDKYEAGQYKINLKVENSILDIWWYIGGNHTYFNLTDSLHGDLKLRQNETDRPNSFVAVNKSVYHYIKIPDQELEFLKKNSSSIYTYWFIDCEYIDKTNDFALNHTYLDVMGTHDVEAIVVADNEPLPPLTTTTTSTTTTSTTPKPTTTSKTTTTSEPTTTSKSTTTSNSTTTDKPTTTVEPTTTQKNISEAPDNTVHKVAKRAISNKTTMKKLNNVENFACNNIIPIGNSYTFGRYRQTIKVREPISTINITGNYWLQHGDLLNLAVKYTGSPPFDYCIKYMLGQYNTTGNETCSKDIIRALSNEFTLVHYFSDSDPHTVVVIIENEIGKTVSAATITIYKVQVHAQLSVIVVPVFFCLVAVILIVFGIAYYQHRTRHAVEVADFDFGQGHHDYKTFTERLRDSFSNAFNFRQRDDTESLTTNTRYDSMT